MAPSDMLSRIAEALSIPVEAFHGSVADRDAVEHLRREEEAMVLALVQAHLHRCEPEAQQRFVQAVQAMAFREMREG